MERRETLLVVLSTEILVRKSISINVIIINSVDIKLVRAFKIVHQFKS